MKTNLRVALEVAAAFLVAAPTVRADKDYVPPAGAQVSSPWDVPLDPRAFAKAQKHIAKNEVRAIAHTIVGKPLVAADATGRFTLRGARYDGHMVAVDSQTIVLDNVKQGKDGTDPTPVIVNNTSASGLALGVQVITGVANGVGQAFDVFGFIGNCFHGGSHDGNTNNNSKTNVKETVNQSNVIGSTITTLKQGANSRNDGNIGFGSNLNGANTSLSGGSAQNFTNNTSNGGVSGNGGTGTNGAARPQTTAAAKPKAHTK